jgi:hypothetical protein
MVMYDCRIGNLLARSATVRYHDGKVTGFRLTEIQELAALMHTHCAPLKESSSNCCQPQTATGERYYLKVTPKHLLVGMFLRSGRSVVMIAKEAN